VWFDGQNDYLTVDSLIHGINWRLDLWIKITEPDSVAGTIYGVYSGATVHLRLFYTRSGDVHALSVEHEGETATIDDW
jgi:hypothetical protein